MHSKSCYDVCVNKAQVTKPLYPNIMPILLNDLVSSVSIKGDDGLLSRQPKLHPQKYVVKIGKGKKGLVWRGVKIKKDWNFLLRSTWELPWLPAGYLQLNQQQKELPLLREKEIALNLCLQEFILLRKKYSWWTLIIETINTYWTDISLQEFLTDMWIWSTLYWPRVNACDIF